MNRNTQKARATRGDERSNGGDKVVKILRVYESGKVRAARTPPGGWEAKGRAHALPADVADKPAPTLAQVTGERVKNPAKVAAGKARAAKAALAREAAGKTAAPAKKAAAKKPAKKAAAAKKPKAKAKRHPKAGPKKIMTPKPSPFPTAAKTKPKAAKKGEPSATAMVVVAVRVTKAQKRKLGKLGGGEWMRDKIERATIQAK